MSEFDERPPMLLLRRPLDPPGVWTDAGCATPAEAADLRAVLEADGLLFVPHAELTNAQAMRDPYYAGQAVIGDDESWIFIDPTKLSPALRALMQEGA